MKTFKPMLATLAIIAVTSAASPIVAAPPESTVGEAAIVPLLGKFVESVVQFSQAPGEVELVSQKYPDVKSMADLKGKNLGVTGLGSSTNFLTQYLLTKTGVKLGEFTS